VNRADKPLEKLTHQLLDESLDELDDSVLSRLRYARLEALKVADSQSSGAAFAIPRFPSWLAPVSTGTAFASIALMVTLFSFQPHSPEESSTILLEDIKLMSANEELEFYQNLEFYLWLEDETTS